MSNNISVKTELADSSFSNYHNLGVTLFDDASSLPSKT